VKNMPICERTIPLTSKKFLAYLLAEVTWKLLIGYLAYQNVRTATLIVAVVVAGFLEAAYIGSQAILDRYIRLAEIAASRGLPHSDKEGTPDERADGASS
jgi:hypothetical protein